MRPLSLATLLGFFCFLFLLFLIFGRSESGAEEAYFSKVLSEAEVVETVRVDERVYEVSEGLVVGLSGAVGARERLRAQKLAYSLALARRAPLLDLTGTNPEKLMEAVRDLSRARDGLMMIQETTREALIVRSLYPIEFLTTLAQVESARQDFLNSGDDLLGARYALALEGAVRAGKRSIADFKKTFQHIEKSSGGIRIPGLGGTITVSRLSASLTAIEHGFDATAQSLRKRRSCISGDLDACSSPDLAIPLLDTGVPPPFRPELRARADEVRSIFAEATGQPEIETAKMIELSSSVCAGALPAPYYFLPPLAISRPPRQFLNDIFFIPTNQPRAPVLEYLRTKLNMRFSRSNPLSFYQCPDVGSDTSAILATVSAVSHAQARSSRTPEAIRLLSRPFYSEADARSYVAAALASVPDDDLIALSLIFENRGAELEKTVQRIADIELNDLRLKEEGVPLDLRAEYLLLVHSAYPTLFQSYNPSFGAERVSLREKNAADLKELLQRKIPYSILRESVSREDIIRDMRAHSDFENAD